MRSLAPCPPPPRPFPLGAIDAWTQFSLLFGGIWVFVGCMVALVFALAGGPVLGDFTLDRHGVVTQAMPVSVTPTSSRWNGQRVYEITYSFTDRAGVLHMASVGSTDTAVVERARRHVPLGIEYDPRDPSLTRIKGASASGFGPFALFPLMFALVGGIILAIGIRQALRTRAIYVHGEAVRATVTAVSPSKLRLNRRRVMRVEYEFDTPLSRVSGQGTTVDSTAVGAMIWVIHLPAEPHENVPVPADA